MLHLDKLQIMMHSWPNISFVNSLSNVLDFKCNSLLSVKPDVVTFALGIMVFWNITNRRGDQKTDIRK